MEDYRTLAEKKFEGRKEQMPKHNGTVSQYQKRFEVFAQLIQEANTTLRELSNKFIVENNCSFEEIEEIREINKQIIESIISHFRSNK